MRLDFQQIGRTWWDPYNVTSRDPVSLVRCADGPRRRKVGPVRLVEDLFDKKYNTEFSPGDFFGRLRLGCMGSI